MMLLLITAALADTGDTGASLPCMQGGVLYDRYCYYEWDWGPEPTQGPYKCAEGSDFGWADYSYNSDGEELVLVYDHGGVKVGEWVDFLGGGCVCEGTVVYELIYGNVEGTCIAPTRVWPAPEQPEQTGCLGGSAALLIFGGALLGRRRQ